VGLLDAPLRIEAAGIVGCMAARLQPWSVGQMLGDSPDRPPRGWRDAESVFGRRLSTVSKLVERCDWQPLVKYSDQPHMTRHFRRYSGQTPVQFVRSSMAKKKWPADQDVAFIQEADARDG
jgi:hypothetical protein